MGSHNSNCDDFRFCFHAVTGGDFECVCHLYPDLISILYLAMYMGRLRQDGSVVSEKEYENELAEFDFDLPRPGYEICQ